MPLTPERELELAEMISRGRERREADARGERPRQWSPEDYRQATIDALLVSMGEKVADPHPIAERVDPVLGFGLMRSVDVSLREIGGRDIRAMEPDERIRMAGSQSDLPSILVEVARSVARTRVNRSLRKVLAVTAPVQVRNYHPQGYVLADIGAVPELTYSTELRDLPAVSIAATGESVQLASASCLLTISRQAIVNDQPGVVAAGLRAFASQAATREAKMCFGLLASNPNLQDGSPWLSAGAGNLLSAVALDAAGLGQALEALRNQRTESNELCDADGAYLLVNGQDEKAALDLVHSMQTKDEPLQVIATAHMTATNWAVLADPQDFPTIARATMEGSSDSIDTESDPKPSMRRDGLGVRMIHAAGFSPVSRTGIVLANKT